MEKLKARWGIKSNFQIIVIFFVFALNGSIAVRLATPVTHFFGLYQDTTNPWLFWPVRIALIFPIYQILLVVVGTLFGQHQFFWNMEKKMIRRLGLGSFLKD
ncbi:MAG: diacylglyceryl transferase [Flavobacteriales bacterium CG_4_8_14_3_um_filter_35_10]|nr:diacylglyceryl transferase [Zetaproteobacteria bacterium]OIO13267.1 MAG: diacylglyceryl transferase [Flavobacteriaceae bacterium CG1_02_35_72]PIR14200.1 MAG: diacylglyceryl transferase [Flavobacteriales bacterium CG11_big_fil_rev_8_21_14_0_20_35_7]PIX06645.1 MAG: diacylglyceryl transferase [Flavobacteriales bacterium CG_4_8_14_3_um_filter_35_10]